jgi:CD151 antigen
MAVAYKKSKEEGCCSINFVKYVLFIFNFVFLISGIAVLAVGVWTIIDKHQYVNLLSTSTYMSIAYLLISAGITVIIVSIIGCIGVWREDRCALLIYTFLLLIIFLVEACAGIMAYVYEDQVWTELQNSLKDTFVKNYKFNIEKTKEIDKMQKELKCCGALSYQDWKSSRWLKEMRTNNTVPDSCCKTISVGCGYRNHPSNIYYDGCAKSFENTIQDHLIIVGAVGLGVCIVQIFGMVLSCCLYVKLKEWEENY